MNSPKVPRLKDVAAEANVSVGAASRILRGDTSRFGVDTTARVLAAAKTLGWRQNLLISGMQTGSTKTVGVMIPPYDSFWISVLSGLHNRLAEEDYLPITVWLGDLASQPYFEESGDAGVRQINRLLDRRVDALIMWPQIAIAFREYFAEVAKTNVPVVVIDAHMDKPLGDAVSTTEKKSTEAVARCLLDLGHRKIGYLCEREDEQHSWSRIRIKHFKNAIIEGGGTVTCSFHLNQHGSDGLAVATKLLMHESRPTAIFAVNDHLARNIYQAASKLGLRIPHDFSVIGFGDLDFATMLEPPLTTVQQNPSEMGRKAADLVLSRLTSEQTELSDFVEVEVEGELIIRDSIASVPE